MKAYSAPRHVLVALAALVVASASGCAAAPEEAPAEAANSDLSETPHMLTEAAKTELANVGFSGDEINAVAESIAISKVLGVQSFVKEANDGDAKTDSSVRRESHGKAQGCLRAKVEVTTSTGAGVFKSGASYPAWVRLSNGGATSTTTRVSTSHAAGRSSSSMSPRARAARTIFSSSPRRASS